jgi:uncharacterized protein YdeI (YjbR/CyaY-like superfamily)
MAKKEIGAGVVHKVPADLRKALISSSEARLAWEDISPLARNEWICWVESAKKTETRNRRIRIAKENLSAGKRRPCCWPGCPHR